MLYRSTHNIEDFSVLERIRKDKEGYYCYNKLRKWDRRGSFFKKCNSANKRMRLTAIKRENICL